ncbi:MAG: efflux RND transporter periplasmic adaptor subunit [Proteobacteria bacterium]|nr:efflux RND transporter periplasmic adaptor subunit [Pseudomonadota bacterium]
MKNDMSCASPARRDPARLSRAPAVLAACALAYCGGCSSSGDGSPAAAGATSGNVTVTAAQRQHLKLYTVEPLRFHRSIETTGVVDFDNDQATSVLAPFSGPVRRLLVSPGDRVRAGQPLALVDSPDFASALSAYRKALGTARTNRRLADLDKDLVQHNGVSQREQAQAETDARNAEADRDAALQALVALQIPSEIIRDLEAGRPIPHLEGTIRAPLAGTVAERLITPGQLLQAGSTPCFTVANLARVWVMARVFDSDLPAVSRGDPAEVMTDVGARSFSGTVDNIAALVDPDTRSVAVRVVVQNPGEILKKQMYVRVRIDASKEDSGLLIPVSAVLRDDQNLPFVYLSRADGSFARQHVTLGTRVADRYDITAGLNPGDQTVVEGGVFMQFMQSQ